MNAPTDAVAVREAAARVAETWPAVAGTSTLKHIAAAIRQLDLPGGEEVPGGYVLVPREPTMEMAWAAHQACLNGKTWTEICTAMIAAAPARVERSGDGGGA